MDWKEFEEFARKIMSRYFDVRFAEKNPKNFPKRFDMVSQNEDVVGDAKFLTLVHRKRLPPAKIYGNSQSCLAIRKSWCKETVFGVW